MADGKVTIECVLDPEKFEKEYAKVENQLEKNQANLNKKATIKAKYEMDKSSIERQQKEIMDKSAELERRLAAQRIRLGTLQEGSKGYRAVTAEITKINAEQSSLDSKLQNLDEKWSLVDLKLQNVNSEMDKLNGEQAQYNAQLENMNAKRSSVYSTAQMQSVTNSLKEGINQISSKTDGLITKARNWALAVFSIRGAYSLIRSAIGTVTQYNTELANKIESIKYSLAMAVAPVIETIVNWVYTIVQYIQYIVKALTGYDIFASAAQSSAKAMASAAGSAKTIHKELAGFDEMNVMSDNSSGGGGAGGGGIPEAMEGLSDVEIPKWLKDLVDFLKPIWEWISNIAEALGPVGTFLALWGGGKLLKLITGLIGSSGGKAGLLGLVGAIELLAGALLVIKPLVEDMPAVADRLEGTSATFQGPVGAGLQAIGENFDKWLTDIFMPDAKPGERFSTELTAKKIQELYKMLGKDVSYEDAWLTTTNLNLVNDYKDAIYKLNKEYENNAEATEQTKKKTQEYMSQLEDIIDSNGRVKSGYEGIAKTLVDNLAKATGENITLDGNQIKMNGEVITSFNELKSSIDKTVESLKDKLEQEKLSTEYTKTIETEIEVRKKLEEADKNLVEAQKSGDQDRIESAQRAKNEIQKEYENLEKRESELQQEMIENQIRSTDTLSKGLVEQYDLSSDTLDDIFKNNKKNWQDTYDQLDSDRKAYMLDATEELSNHKDEYVKLWSDLADESEESFAKGLVNMSSAEQKELTTMLTGTGTKAEQITQKIGIIPDHARLYLQQNWEALSKEYNGDLDKMVSKAETEGNSIANKLSDPLSNMSESEKANQWGNHFLSNWLSGFKNKWDFGGLSLVRGVANKIAEQFEHSIPSINSPFSGDQYWGAHFIENITNGMKKASPELLRTAQGLADQVADITSNGLINYPSSGTLIYGAGDFNTASSIGKEIGKNISLTATIVNKMNSRVISRELVQTQTEQDFAYNS